MNNEDLFNSSFAESVRKSLSPEQLAEYEKIGDYMYSHDGYKVATMGSQVTEPVQEELIAYAISALRSGLHPSDLSLKEIAGIAGLYGDKWYEEFGYTKEDIRPPSITVVQGCTAQGNSVQGQSVQKTREILRRRPRNNK